jgi:hypothetical protein
MNKALKLLSAAFLLGVLQMLFIGLWLRYQWSVFLLIGVVIVSGVADSVCICIAAVLVWRRYREGREGTLQIPHKLLI